MRCLITGFTAKQRGEGRPQVVTLLDGMERALKHAGWSVERRKVDPDEDLRAQFDLAVLGVYDYSGTSATAQKFQSSRVAFELPYVLAWDDWNADSIWGSVRKGARAFMRSGLHQNDANHQSVKEELTQRYDYELLAKRWSQAVHACVCCAFEWGDHSMLKAKHNFDHFLAWDPSPFVTGMYGDYNDRPKSRQWVCASLNPQQTYFKRLGLTWPVKDFSKPHAGARSWQVDEDSVVDAYCDSWGVLSPPYDGLLGSGWWRNRFVFAADAQAIMCADVREVKPIAPGDKTSHYFWQPNQVETFEIESLKAVALEQRDELQRWWLNVDQSAQQLAEWVERSAGV